MQKLAKKRAIEAVNIVIDAIENGISNVEGKTDNFLKCIKKRKTIICNKDRKYQ